MLSIGLARRNGELLIGGVPCTELALAYGTPLLAIDYDAFDAAIERFMHACSPHGIDVAYAGKALLLVALAKHLKHTPLGLDVCSLGELMAAERAGFPAERLTMHGCGKTPAEIDAVLEGRVGRVVVDHVEELRQLAGRHTAQPIAVLLRINTATEAHTHEFVRTSGQHSKFGFDPAALPAALELLAGAPHLRFTGLHSHIGSQIYEPQRFAENARSLMAIAAVCASSGFATHTLIAGGGFGIPMRPQDGVLDLTQVAQSIASTVRREAQSRNLPVPAIGIEPGRALIGAAGVSLYEVMAAKRQFGRPYAIVNGGIYENPRPALYDAYHHTVCASRESAHNVETVVCGRTCENDRLADAMLPEDLRAGDLLAMFSTGAYTYSMASNYNRFARPAVAAVRASAHSLIARREDTADLLRNDVDA
ncbi:MAG: diaminopimelate decarboxylase [Candidatus Baltobacteraceae bacterium]